MYKYVLLVFVLLSTLSGAGSVLAQSQIEPATDSQIVVNINTADANTLSEQLDGVGASRAAAIVRYREQFGPFETVDELTNVSGIGSSILASNKDRLTVE